MSEKASNPFGAKSRLDTRAGAVHYFSLRSLEKAGLGAVSRLPFSIRVLLEALVRNVDGRLVKEDDVSALASWDPSGASKHELPFMPARVLMQDFTGVPAVVDLAAMRSAMTRLGGAARRVNPIIPVDLVIDHSVQVDVFGSAQALARNAEIEFERNRERYEFLRWGAEAFDNFRVVPPATGIVHQVNLEYLANVVQVRASASERVAFPDSLVGTDSHTTMINGLGVLGWGVGGIEAEATMLGQPLFILTPEVVGLRLDGELPRGATATDLVLTATELLRRHKVVGKFVEYCGPGLASLSLADRATLANMAPEYGATMGFFPVDRETLNYLAATGRPPELVDLVERYTREQGLFRTGDAEDPLFSTLLELDMSTVEPSLAGPRRPQDRVPLRSSRERFEQELVNTFGVEDRQSHPVEINGQQTALSHGSVVIAAITSCTNTSNPSVMIGAGLLAKKAVDRGLRVPAHVKTSLAPGSRVVTRYLDRSGVLRSLEQLGFHVVGYGCTTCIGNSGPLPETVSRAIRNSQLVAVSVLSGNRNFEGRVNPDVRANYLASPPLVVAYALAGTMDIDFDQQPLGTDGNGESVFLADIWPSLEEVRDVLRGALDADGFRDEYGNVFDGNPTWNAIRVPTGEIYAWDEASTYIKEPSFFEGLEGEPSGAKPIRNARVLVLLGDSVTTDHISPAGAIPADSPAGLYLIERGIEQREFNSFGSRRGNHEVMIRGTFGNIRLRNKLAPGTEGGWTIHVPSGEQTSIYEAAMRYRQEATPLLVLAGKEYGTGSSRDWAAKGTMLLGVRAVIAESFERIHRSNLVGMGVLPLEFAPETSAASLGLTGRETYDIEGLDQQLEPGQSFSVTARDESGRTTEFLVRSRLDSPVEIQYYENGGILQTVLRGFLDR
ncbi:MAG: aconitate hydratase AcnA [Acidobacteriota bacterium]|nr:MAG: aconitate hydratase AcnA [Acidobacteriota bacterium]